MNIRIKRTSHEPAHFRVGIHRDDGVPADALLGLAFNQTINSLRSFAGIVFLAKRTHEYPVTGEIDAKSFKTS
jgi:hypothetical protein